MAENIVMANLLPSMALGASSPIVSTRPDQRDGTRNVTPPTVSDRGNARFDSYVNAPVQVGRIGSGTPDPKFDLDRLVYQGAFWIRDANASKDLFSSCFVAPNGLNGSAGSLIIAGNPDKIWEYQIPETLSTDINTSFTSVLPEAVRLQGPFDVGASGANRVGWMKVIDGKLWLQTFNDYQTSQGDHVFVIDGYTDFGTSTSSGALEPSNDAETAKYVGKLDSTWAASLGNEYFSGIFYNLSNVGRGSQGPSFYTFDPTSYTQGDTTFSFNRILRYDTSNPLTDPEDNKYVPTAEQNTHYSSDKITETPYNRPVYWHYYNAIDMPISSWLRLPVNTLNPEPENNRISGVSSTVRMFEFELMSESNGEYVSSSPAERVRTHYNGSDYYFPDAQALIPEEGALLSTIVVKSADGNTTYTKGTDYYIKEYKTLSKFLKSKNPNGSFTVYDPKDIHGRLYIYTITGGSIAPDTDVIIEYDRISARHENLSYYPSPASGIPNHETSFQIFCGTAFQVPDTDTILWLGGNGGVRYSLSYKSSDTDYPEWKNHAGSHPLDPNDVDNYFWAMNLNDIKTAQTLGDINYSNFYSCGIFDNRWLEIFEDDYGKFHGGAWDEATKTLYISKSKSSGQYSKHTIVSVYKYI